MPDSQDTVHILERTSSNDMPEMINKHTHRTSLSTSDSSIQFLQASHYRANYICFAERSVHTPHPAVCTVFSTKRSPVSFTWNRAVRTCAISACGIVCREVIVARAVPRVPSFGITYSISLVMNTAIQSIGRSCRTRILHPFMKIPL